MNDKSDQYVIDLKKDAAFLVIYEDIDLLRTIYVFKDQLCLADDPVWRKESVLYMAVHHPLIHCNFGTISGFHWLDEDQLSRIDYLKGEVSVEVVDYSCKRNRINFWVKRWSSFNRKNTTDQSFLEAANNSISFDMYCEQTRGFAVGNLQVYANDNNDPLFDLQLPWNAGMWSLRSGAKKYARLFAECFSESDVVDASKAEVL